MYLNRSSVLIVSLAIFICLICLECSNQGSTIMKIEKQEFGKMPNGDIVQLYTLINTQGMQVGIINYGGIITSIIVPDKDGNMGDVVLGFDNLESYVNVNPYFGCVVGRYGNRIAKGKFSLDGVEYSLAVNNGPNHLHGGRVGFDKVLWDVQKEIIEADQAGIVLHYLSKDMEEGYPGNLDVTMTYTLTSDNEIVLDYKATTDKKTVCNLTNHSYFNLKDGGKSTILDHEVWIDADQFVPIDETSIPLGDLMDVKGTPFDFTSPKKVGDDIDADDIQIKNGIGYDHNFVINEVTGELKSIAKVKEFQTDRVLEVLTTEPGVQFYSGNFLDGTLKGKGGVVYEQRSGLCLETQHYPDSPNQPQFPTTILNPGETYHTATVYKFSVE